MFGPIEIPNKSSFKINEVCALTGVKSYVLRFWESEFSEIAPMVSSSGEKLYEYRDIETILVIKKLLFEDKLTIERAKAQMKVMMPRESLVEDQFRDGYSSQNLRKNHQDDSNETHESSPKISSAMNLRESVAQRVLVDSDFEKMATAKNLLRSMISRIETIQDKKHWG